MPVAAVLDQPSDLIALASEWDALALAAARPTSAPGWMLPWWTHAAPPGAVLNVVAVHEDDRLIGLAPFFRVDRGRGTHLEPLAGGSFSSSVSVLAAAGRESEVAAAVAAALAGSPRPPDWIEVGPAAADDPWPEALRNAWPGRRRPLALRAEPIPSPVIELGEDGFEGWLDSRRPSFRKAVRRRGRGFAKAGGTFRQCTEETLAADVEAFARLHTARWQGLGSSRLVEMEERLRPMLIEVGRALGPGERFRIHLLEVAGEPIAAALSIEAGGEVSAINTGWDEAHRNLAPLQLLQVDAVEDSVARGDRRINLGRGASEAKLAVATGAEQVVEAVMVPLGTRSPLALYDARRFVRRCAQERVREAMPDSAYDRLRTLKRRLRGGDPEVAPA
jgi:CelD/BcsL family acetyltransferase involved in cellulose biosynthesis